MRLSKQVGGSFAPQLQSLSNVEWSVKSGHAKSITFKRDGGQTRVSSLARSAAETYTQRRLFEAL